MAHQTQADEDFQRESPECCASAAVLAHISHLLIPPVFLTRRSTSRILWRCDQEVGSIALLLLLLLHLSTRVKFCPTCSRSRAPEKNSAHENVRYELSLVEKVGDLTFQPPVEVRNERLLAHFIKLVAHSLALELPRQLASS